MRGSGGRSAHRRTSRGTLWRILLLALAAAATAGCGDDQDPQGAKAFWDKIHAESYRSWARAPGYETRKPTNAPHSDEVDIYLNPTMADALASGAATFPVGSIIAKDGYNGSEHAIIAAMEKRDAGWYWAEWDADSAGEADYSGAPAICTDCHASGKDYVRFMNP